MKPRFCCECIHIRRALFDVQRCAKNRLSWIAPHARKELYPCAAINVDGKCPDWDNGKRKPKQMDLPLGE